MVGPPFQYMESDVLLNAALILALLLVLSPLFPTYSCWRMGTFQKSAERIEIKRLWVWSKQIRWLCTRADEISKKRRKRRRQTYWQAPYFGHDRSKELRKIQTFITTHQWWKTKTILSWIYGFGGWTLSNFSGSSKTLYSGGKGKKEMATNAGLRIRNHEKKIIERW